MNCTVLTPEKEIFSGPIKSVKVPGLKGQFEILNGHAAIVSSLGEGVIRIIDENNQTQTFDIAKGFIEVLNNEVSLLVQSVK